VPQTSGQHETQLTAFHFFVMLHGGNQLVVGAAVRGGDLYGRYPLLAVNGDEDIGGGRLIPSTSTDQYVATLARWMAVPDRDISCIAPHIGNFAVKDIGFMA
jgi:uncharacterized protein (DUF1501 family)